MTVVRAAGTRCIAAATGPRWPGRGWQWPRRAAGSRGVDELRAGERDQLALARRGRASPAHLSRAGSRLTGVRTKSCAPVRDEDRSALCEDLAQHVVDGLPVPASGADRVVETRMRRMGFPVWSRCVSPAGTVEETLGDVNIPIICAGRLLRPRRRRGRRRRRRGRGTALPSLQLEVFQARLASEECGRVLPGRGARPGCLRDAGPALEKSLEHRNDLAE